MSLGEVFFEEIGVWLSSYFMECKDTRKNVFIVIPNGSITIHLL